MSTTTDVAQEIYQTGLRNQHAVEHQAIQILQRQIERVKNYPEMLDRMQQHVAESRAQAERLDELLAGLGTSASTVKDTALSITGNLAAFMHMPAPDEVVKNSFVNYAFEHFEIASYKSLLVLAELTGHTAAAAPLNLSLAEEVDMAQWIDAHLASTTKTFVARSQAGVKADR